MSSSKESPPIRTSLSENSLSDIDNIRRKLTRLKTRTVHHATGDDASHCNDRNESSLSSTLNMQKEARQSLNGSNNNSNGLSLKNNAHSSNLLDVIRQQQLLEEQEQKLKQICNQSNCKAVKRKVKELSSKLKATHEENRQLQEKLNDALSTIGLYEQYFANLNAELGRLETHSSLPPLSRVHSQPQPHSKLQQMATTAPASTLPTKKQSAKKATVNLPNVERKRVRSEESSGDTEASQHRRRPSSSDSNRHLKSLHEKLKGSRSSGNMVDNKL